MSECLYVHWIGSRLFLIHPLPFVLSYLLNLNIRQKTVENLTMYIIDRFQVHQRIRHQFAFLRPLSFLSWSTKTLQKSIKAKTKPDISKYSSRRGTCEKLSSRSSRFREASPGRLRPPVNSLLLEGVDSHTTVVSPCRWRHISLQKVQFFFLFVLRKGRFRSGANKWMSSKGEGGGVREGVVGAVVQKISAEDRSWSYEWLVNWRVTVAVWEWFPFLHFLFQTRTWCFLSCLHSEFLILRMWDPPPHPVFVLLNFPLQNVHFPRHQDVWMSISPLFIAQNQPPTERNTSKKGTGQPVRCLIHSESTSHISEAAPPSQIGCASLSAVTEWNMLDLSQCATVRFHFPPHISLSKAKLTSKVTLNIDLELLQ